jgi:ABC-type uncharacterized transport system substrate-binding protein
LLASAGEDSDYAASYWRLPIPIVMATTGDPVQSGVVASFARPGGNVTGVTLYGSELTVDRIEVLKEVLPEANRIAEITAAQYRALAAQNEPSHQSWWNAPLSYRKRMDILRGAND